MLGPRGQFFDAGRFMLEAANKTRQLAEEELREVLESVARARFDPEPNTPARGVSGIYWQGRRLNAADRITSGERHYLRHVVIREEWPAGTTLEDYIRSISEVILDDRSGVFTSLYQGRWQLGIIRRSESLRGIGGAEWVVIEYRIDIGYWTTAYQLQAGVEGLMVPAREELLWLRQPK